MDFALIMFVLLLVTGGVWLLDRFVLAGKRETGTTEPWWVEYAKSFFPVILIVFFIRSFLAEPFKIPSGSMIPTLQVGDFILVNKFTYGIRLPIINRKIIQLNNPQRGDVMVFHYPENPSLDYIKRVIALPGDTVEYRNKRLWINGVEQPQQAEGDYNYVETGLNFVHTEKRIETLGDHKYTVLVNPDTPTLHLASVAEFRGRENCSYDNEMVRCKVPDGHYFMLGDNRDNSRDSRYWGFVPDNQIVGKAFFIWMNFSDLKRIGLSIN
ncbi:MAG: signal peptidase I [Gallionellales bacterium RIFCSPLOWO2_12_FULL_59_22]|nr:MAG: signal peptidase I [Gallionellales bacterium RIFCSPLOWO2_02_FULL_59_110]OGT05071.1 MAG: signal peptidase I [Gallionellales bacterium RIFCSPLOWO2_02_58_13]OGT12706.1 MAG: signal peptidase I [Gallionellales bacterium RIFCSPLOWO2_12_FULL_59_22]